jgi:hypothetical protein
MLKRQIFFGTEGVVLFDLLSTGYVRSRYDCQIGVLLPPSLTSARLATLSIFLVHVYSIQSIPLKLQVVVTFLDSYSICIIMHLDIVYV